MSILSPQISQHLEFLSHSWKRDVLLVLSIMFAFIGVIVKPETRLPRPQWHRLSSLCGLRGGRGRPPP